MISSAPIKNALRVSLAIALTSCVRSSQTHISASTLRQIYDDLSVIAQPGLRGTIDVTRSKSSGADIRVRNSTGDYDSTYEIDAAGNVVSKTIHATLQKRAVPFEGKLGSVVFAAFKKYPDLFLSVPQRVAFDERMCGYVSGVSARGRYV